MRFELKTFLNGFIASCRNWGKGKRNWFPYRLIQFTFYYLTQMVESKSWSVQLRTITTLLSFSKHCFRYRNWCQLKVLLKPTPDHSRDGRQLMSVQRVKVSQQIFFDSYNFTTNSLQEGTEFRVLRWETKNQILSMRHQVAMGVKHLDQMSNQSRDQGKNEVETLRTCLSQPRRTLKWLEFYQNFSPERLFSKLVETDNLRHKFNIFPSWSVFDPKFVLMYF